MKRLLAVILLIYVATSSLRAAYPVWEGTFNGAQWPSVGDSGKGLYQVYTSGGVDELWHYNSQTATWTYVGYVNGTIYSLYLSGSSLYVGGSFTTTYDPWSTAVSAANIAVVNTTTRTWSAKGTPGVVPMTILAISSSNIYIGSGNYTSLCRHQDQNLLKRWNGTSWSTVGGGLLMEMNDDSAVHSIVTDGAYVFVGGSFLGAKNGGTEIISPNIIRWNPSSGLWAAMGSGLTRGTNSGVDCNNNPITLLNPDSFVFSLAYLNGHVYAAGSFTSGGGLAKFTTSGSTASFNGLASSVLGAGNSRGYALYVDYTDLYVAGDFDSITGTGGISANGIAKYNDGSVTWSALSTGLRYYSAPSYYHGAGYHLTKNANSVFVWGGYDYAGSIAAYPARWQLSAD